jgi:hypothetical protein
MAAWSEFPSAETELAETARALLYPDGSGRAMLATVRSDAPPHINPISVGIVGGRSDSPSEWPPRYSRWRS